MKRVTFGALRLIFSVWLLSVITFVMSRVAPGDPLVAYYGDAIQRMSTAEQEAARIRLGLDQSLITQYWKWLCAAVQGDFGISYQYKQSVLTVVGDRVGNTLLLGGISFVLTFGLALVIGIACATTKRAWVDRVCCQIGTVISCVPTFWLSLLLILLFGVTLGWLPISGAYDIGQQDNVWSWIVHLILPVSTMVLSHVWYYASLVRGKFLEELSRDYVTMARAKGSSERAVLYQHCLRNVLPSYVSLMAISIPHLVAGSYLVEMVFSYPGLGTLAFESAKYHDYNLLMLLTLATGTTVMLCSAIGHQIGQWADPRTRENEQGGAL